MTPKQLLRAAEHRILAWWWLGIALGLGLMIYAVVMVSRPAGAMGGPRGVQCCDRQGNCHWATNQGGGTWKC